MNNVKQHILNIFKQERLAWMATSSPEGIPRIWDVSLSAVQDFPLIFSASTNSLKIQHIQQNPRVHMLCARFVPPDRTEYLLIQGEASISTDPELKLQHWNPFLARNFDGPDDPFYAIVTIDPLRIEIEYKDQADSELLVWEKSVFPFSEKM